MTTVPKNEYAPQAEKAMPSAASLMLENTVIPYTQDDAQVAVIEAALDRNPSFVTEEVQQEIKKARKAAAKPGKKTAKRK